MSANWQNGFQQPPAPLDQRMQSYDSAVVQTQQTVKDLAFFQRMEDTRHQIELIREQRALKREEAAALKDARLSEIEAKSRADLALANVNNQHQHLIVLTAKQQAQAAPVAAPAIAPVAAPAIDLDRILLWISVAGALWCLIREIRVDAPTRQLNPRRAKAHSRYRRAPMSQIRNRYR
jgi:hypothetical protein